MIRLLALRNFALKPKRTLLLLFGYSVGVAVMIVLLSIGEALVAQAREERLVGGGDVSVLPQGIDIEVMNAFDTINFNHSVAFNPGTSTDTFRVTSAYTDPNTTNDPGGRLGQIVWRINW